LIGLHPGARDGKRRWPTRCFLDVARRLASRRDASFVLLGDGETGEAAAELHAGLGSSCVNLVGRTSLPVLGAVIEALSVLVTTDSGPAHVAYALDTPTVTVFRRGGSLRYGPPDAPRFIGLEPGPGLRRVEAERAAEAAERLLAEAYPRRASR
jgi:ADP-heptose:LPS heptosyltransferase